MGTTLRGRTITGFLCTAAIAASTLAVQAADIKVLSAVGFRGVLSEAVPKFERASGDRVRITYGTLGQIMKRIEKGETADVIVLPRQGLDDLARQGKIGASEITPIARSRVGMAVRKGLRKPDISTADGFRKALLEAKSVSTVDPGSGGVSALHFRTLFERMAIAEQMRPKLRYRAAGTLRTVTAREDVALNQMQDLVDAKGLVVVGPLPEELQLKTVFAAAAASRAHGAASRALVAYLGGPEAGAIARAKGLEPLAP